MTGWADACPACKGYPDQAHTCDGFALARKLLQEGEECILYERCAAKGERESTVAEFAAARADLDRVEAERDRLEEKRKQWVKGAWHLRQENERLRADAERLAEALRRIARAPTKSATWVGDVARAALAAHEREEL